jgi:uncharacterized protein HemY
MEILFSVNLRDSNPTSVITVVIVVVIVTIIIIIVVIIVDSVLHTSSNETPLQLQH